MASVTRTTATRTGSRREDAVTTNGKTARERALIAVEKAKAAAAIENAKREADARDQPVTVTVASYDPTTGDWLTTTPDGGTVRAQSLTNGALTGLRLPLQRFPGSQTARINAPPSAADNGPILAEIESAQRDLFNILGAEERTIGIESPTAGQVYPIVARNDAPRTYVTLHVINTNTNGTLATAGTATVLINGAVAAVGAPIAVGDRVGLRVDTVGVGVLSASVYVRLT